MRRHIILKRSIKGALILGGLCALIPSVYGQGIGLKKLDEMLTPTESKIARGKTVYARQCVTCHGESGKNDTSWARENNLTGSLTDNEFKTGGGLIQTYNLLAKKQDGVNHPVYNAYIPYQDLWAVSHYANSLSKANPTDPPELREQAEFEAVNGVCNTEIKDSIGSRVTPKGDEQMETGKKLYAANCTSCHGDQGLGNGAAAGALQPAPRNFVGEPKGEWTNGTSPLAIFGTLANGIEGTSMASYANLSEDERWALTHYVRNWIPKAQQDASTDTQIVEVCRSLSAPPKPDAIPVERAMKFLIEDAPSKRALERAKLGPVYKYSDADASRGDVLFAQNCSSCHGTKGDGTRPSGPYGAIPPFLYLSVAPLQNNDAAGSFDTFATRSSQGAHATLPNMTSVAVMSQQNWKDIQAYVSLLDGSAEFIEASRAAMLNAPVKRIRIKLNQQNNLLLVKDDDTNEPTTYEALKALSAATYAQDGTKLEFFLVGVQGPEGEPARKMVEAGQALGVDLVLEVKTPETEPAVQPAQTPPAPENKKQDIKAPNAPQ